MLESFISYKSKIAGINTTFVPANYTSQTCSRCGATHKESRNGNSFSCKSCGFKLHSDLNAARNIASLGKSENSRLLSISQTSQGL